MTTPNTTITDPRVADLWAEYAHRRDLLWEQYEKQVIDWSTYSQDVELLYADCKKRQAWMALPSPPPDQKVNDALEHIAHELEQIKLLLSDPPDPCAIWDQARDTYKHAWNACLHGHAPDKWATYKQAEEAYWQASRTHAQKRPNCLRNKH